MPNPPLSAEDTPLRLTRRGLLGGTAILATTTLVPAAPLAHPTQTPDSKLTALGRKFEQALSVHDAAQHAFNDCERRYLHDGPEPPPILTNAGALGHLLNLEGSWWSARELRWLLKDQSQRAVWPAARAAYAAAVAFEARDRRFRRRIGLLEAERAHETATDTMDYLSGLILAAPARSPAALAVKGRAVKSWGKPEWWSRQASHADTYERLAAEIIDSAIAAV